MYTCKHLLHRPQLQVPCQRLAQHSISNSYLQQLLSTYLFLCAGPDNQHTDAPSTTCNHHSTGCCPRPSRRHGQSSVPGQVCVAVGQLPTDIANHMHHTSTSAVCSAKCLIAFVCSLQVQQHGQHIPLMLLGGAMHPSSPPCSTADRHRQQVRGEPAIVDGTNAATPAESA